MNTSVTTGRALAALGHEARLDVFRLLVRAGEDGLIIGDIATFTKLPLSTLSHHLRALVAANLVTQERRGREVVNHANFAAVQAALAFLTAECCQGVSLIREGAA